MRKSERKLGDLPNFLSLFLIGLGIYEGLERSIACVLLALNRQALQR